MDSNCVESGSEGFNESQENQKHEALTATTSDLWKITENGIAYTGGKMPFWVLAIMRTLNYGLNGKAQARQVWACVLFGK